jgi:DNA-binding XRE family transcriptional regulator
MAVDGVDSAPCTRGGVRTANLTTHTCGPRPRREKYTLKVCRCERRPRQGSRVSDDPDLTALGREIRDRRKARNLSQEALAELAGLHRNYVGLLERGERNPSATTLFELVGGL